LIVDVSRVGARAGGQRRAAERGGGPRPREGPTPRVVRPPAP